VASAANAALHALAGLNGDCNQRCVNFRIHGHLAAWGILAAAKLITSAFKNLDHLHGCASNWHFICTRGDFRGNHLAAVHAPERNKCNTWPRSAVARPPVRLQAESGKRELLVLQLGCGSRGTYMNTARLANSVPMIKHKTTAIIDELIEWLPNPKMLTSEERRGIIARYTSVLEGNFIYWMTATVIAAKAEQSRPILLENLYEEVHDAHPLMLRKFAMASKAFPTDQDVMAVHNELTNVRQFMGKLSPVKSVLMMGFFEGFIQRFMAYLAYLAREQGSTEEEYTDVHGVCDIEHTEGLFKVLAAEIALTPPDPDADLFEGVTLLRALIEQIIRPQAESVTARSNGRANTRSNLAKNAANGELGHERANGDSRAVQAGRA
jgi:hypothetical protein